MTYIKLPGLKVVRTDGAIYRYHRATSTRLKADPSVNLEAFIAEFKAAEAAMANAVRPVPGTLGGLFARYQISPEFTELAEASRTGYQRAIDALKSQDDMSLLKIDQPWVLKVRDRVFELH